MRMNTYCLQSGIRFISSGQPPVTIPKCKISRKEVRHPNSYLGINLSNYNFDQDIKLYNLINFMVIL